MKESCFGKDYKEDGIFCKTCPDVGPCKEAQKVMINTPGSPNTDVGNPMFETHVQETPAIKYPNGNTTLTVDDAVSLVKKRAKPEEEIATDSSTPPTSRGKTWVFGEEKLEPRGTLGIPFKPGSKVYQRAYYWCKALKKNYAGIQEKFEAGLLGKNSPSSGEKQQEPSKKTPNKPKKPADVIRLPGVPDQPAANIDGAMVGVLQELTSVLKEATTMMRTINASVAAMDSNLQSVRKEIELMRADIKRHPTGKH